MFPGARLFVDYVDYQKVLMMVTEGYGYSEMGVKNSYFIAEAYAMGGFALMFLSPIIVAFSTALGLIILIDLLKRIVGKELCRPIATLLYLKTQSITGGFSHFPLLKGLILIVGQLFIIWILCIVVMHFTNFSLKGGCIHIKEQNYSNMLRTFVITLLTMLAAFSVMSEEKETGYFYFKNLVFRQAKGD